VNPTKVQGVVRSRREPGIVCHEVFYDSGTTLARHAHESALIAWAMDGSYREETGSSAFECGPRSVVFHPAFEEHAIFFGDASRCFAIEIDADEVRGRYDARVPGTLQHLESGPLAAVLANLYAEFRNPDACSSLAIQGLALQLLAGLSRSGVPEVDRGRPSWLDRVEDIIRDGFRARLSLEELASEVGQSPERVSAIFRRVYHRSIAEEQRRLRIEFACERLRDREASLAAIALDAGFSDQPHFSRAFKQVTGTTPARYRLVTYGTCEEP
jgi:AraC family transcriptional regulator